MKNTDLHLKILLLKCKNTLLKILVLENQCKIMVPLFGANMLHQIKALRSFQDGPVYLSTFQACANPA